MYPSQSPEYRREYRRRWREKNRAAYNAYAEDWRRRNLEKRRERENRRNALKRGATVERVDYSVILKRDGLFCYLCREHISRSEVEYDHIIPITRGGSHSYANIAVACSTCNRSKGNKLPEEMSTRVFKRIEKKREEIGG